MKAFGSGPNMRKDMRLLELAQVIHAKNQFIVNKVILTT